MPKSEQALSGPRLVFWTGGWDSTFRVLDLVLIHGISVEPWYVVDDGRKSTEHELKAMEEIRRLASGRSAEGFLLPTRYLRARDVEPDIDLRRKFRKLKNERDVGDQYLWLAEVAKQWEVCGIEVCVQHNEDFAFLLGGRPVKDKIYSVNGFQPEIKEELPESLFNYFSMPTLAVSKAWMHEYAKRHGFADVLDKTWFCHSPTRRGEPCGFCAPCKITAAKGASYRLDKRAKINQKIIGAMDKFARGYRVRRWLKAKLRGY